MPYSAPRLQGCGCVTGSGERCEHQRARKAAHDARRPSARVRGYDGKWDIARKAFLAKLENRHCACGCGRAADMVDHIIPHRGDQRLFWDRKNWQALASSPCHSSRKQSIEARGDSSNFGRREPDRLGTTAQDGAQISFSGLVKP